MLPMTGKPKPVLTLRERLKQMDATEIKGKRGAVVRIRAPFRKPK